MFLTICGINVISLLLNGKYIFTHCLDARVTVLICTVQCAVYSAYYTDCNLFELYLLFKHTQKRREKREIEEFPSLASLSLQNAISYFVCPLSVILGVP